MKKVILSVVIVFQTIILLSQSSQSAKHIASVETGYMYYTYDGRGGLYFNNSYVYVLNSYISVNPGFIMAQTNYNPNKNRIDQSTLLAPYVSALATPLPNMPIVSDLRIGAGVVYQSLRSHSAFLMDDNPNVAYKYLHNNENLWGFIGNIEMTAYKTSFIQVGANISMITSIYKGVYYVDELSFGVKGIIKLQ